MVSRVIMYGGKVYFYVDTIYDRVVYFFSLILFEGEVNLSCLSLVSSCSDG